MLTTDNLTHVEEAIYTFIGDAGAVTARELARFTGMDEHRAQVFLRVKEQAGYLYRDEFGGYGTSCPWPRVGF